MIELCFVACKAAIVDLGSKLKILNGIRLQSLLVSILYILHALFDYCLTLA